MSELTSDERTQSSLKSVTRGASLFFIGRVLSNALRFIFNLLLTRGLGPSLYGIYSYAMTLMSLAIILARVGTGKSLLKYIPANDENPERRNRYVALAYVTALLGSVIVGTGVYLSAPMISRFTMDSDLLIKVLRIFSIVLPFNTLIELTNAVFRGLEKLEYRVAVADIVQPLVQIATVATALFLGYSLIGVTAALAVGAIFVCIVAVGIVFTWSPVRPTSSIGGSRIELFEFYNYSVPLTLKDIGSVLYTRVDILMVGFFLAESSVGIYRLAVLVSGLLVLPLTAFNQLFPSVASRLYTNNQTHELKSVYESVTRWTLTAAIPLALVIGIYSSEFLSIFGTGYTAGSLVLVLFTIGQITNCAVGPSGYLLMMSDHQYVNMANQWVLGVLNVVLNYLFIREYGLIGAALATAGVLSFINVVRVVEVYHFEGLTPYSKSFWKPIIAGVIAAGVMTLLGTILQGYVLLIGGGLIGGMVFLGLLIAFGIEQDDIELFRQTVGKRIEE